MAIKKMMKVFLLANFAVVFGAGSVFAADIKANIKMSGNVMDVEKTKSTGDKEWSWLANEPVNQKDDDGIIIEVDNGNAGAQIAMWYKTASDNGQDVNEADDWTAYFRRTYVWFKPIDMLKFQVGYVGCDEHFKEQIDEWRVGNPFKLTERDWVKHPDYINNNDVEGWGFGAELRPVEPLILNAGITPGKKGGFNTTEESSKEAKSGIYNKDNTNQTKSKVAPWGAGARYFLGEHFELQASFRDGGQDTNRDGTWRVARFGAGYKSDSLFAFVQPIFGYDYDTTKEEWKMNGWCLDMYADFSVSALKFYIHAPVTFRRTDEKDDINYMEMNFKAEYNTGSHGNLDDVKPYIQLCSTQDDSGIATKYRAWLLDKHFKNSLNMSYKVGINFMISGAEIDLGFKYDELSKYARDNSDIAYRMSVPFSVKFKNF